MKFFIKNMVCPRCIAAVRQVFTELGLPIFSINLGIVITSEKIIPSPRVALKEKLTPLGFELLDDKQAQLVNSIKSILIEEIHYQDEAPTVNFSTLLSENLHYNYNHLSRLFSSVEGQTIERFVQAQKIEKVKELLMYDELNLSEIAFQVNYSSSAYLSTQFKKITGMTPSAFKKLHNRARRHLDEL